MTRIGKGLDKAYWVLTIVIMKCNCGLEYRIKIGVPQKTSKEIHKIANVNS